MLRVQIPVGVCNCLGAEEAVRPLALRDVRKHPEDLIAVDGTINDRVGNVDSSRSELACEGLTHDPQTGFRGSERRKSCLSAQRCRRPGEDNRASAALEHYARNFPSEHEAAEAAHPPDGLEIGARRLQRWAPYRV